MSNQETRYSVSILKTVNTKTTACRYFAKQGYDIMERISKVEYDKIRDTCFGMDSFYTEIKSNITRHFQSCIFYIA